MEMAGDGCHNEQIPFGGEAVGPNPTDRAKDGTKREIVTDGIGVPLGVSVEGANRHDMKMTEATLSNVQVVPENPDQDQNLCMDKGFDYPEVYELVCDYGYTPHIRSRGEEKMALKKIPGFRSRRWVSERTHSWMNRFRRLLIRWEKKKDNYLNMIYIACAFITFRVAGVLG
jgi:putative transposase